MSIFFAAQTHSPSSGQQAYPMQVWEGEIYFEMHDMTEVFLLLFFFVENRSMITRKCNTFSFLAKSFNSNSQKNKEFFIYIFIVAARIFG